MKLSFTQVSGINGPRRCFSHFLIAFAGGLFFHFSIL